ncbi:hypothetical protein Tco_1092114 [Tanacetum coccineum]|uniref:Uncharacterized protein n=1 Tax=Tanacetum coccineum TaxID=301880 RepID=A0ABQ5IA51_9ASTR
MGSLPAYNRALCPVLAILSGPGLVPVIIPKRDLGIPICGGNVLGTSLPDALHVVCPGLGVYNPMRCLEGSLVGIVQLLQVLLDARIDICSALGLHMRRQVKLGTSPSTGWFSWNFNDSNLFSRIFIDPFILPDLQHTTLFSGASTPPSYSLGTSRNVECSNCKHLLDKITVLEATVDMYMHPEQYIVNSAALFHEVYNNMGKLDLE